ncbi:MULTISPECIES: hypothetical protein [Streptomyces]|uniref:hypothetical protein n=1 Tax=Streptomyces TaxID=1883 RepID=UPI00163C15F9|nr:MULTISPECIES: hypothetical protein [Streptomyces]MBC2878497.1 hypothetical protein [Streptomyces sp. TYQ1024]UBI38825.1 hypothetical protein K7I03_21795 [Streptomyces mobaraensis]UKW31405.1 hypothetical protein MCU78_21740 [Streptomyces sp. TYQ1024]
MSTSVFVYDAGMLIALERQDSAARLLHRLQTEGGHPPVVPLPVLAQAWRPGRWTPLSRVIPECVIFGVRAVPAPPCGVCIAGHTEDDARRAGRLLATAAVPEQKRPDAVDALAVVVAARHPAAIVVTSDPYDLTAYRDELADGTNVQVLAVPDIAGLLAGKRVLR